LSESLAPHETEEFHPSLEGKRQNKIPEAGTYNSHHPNSKDEVRESHKKIGKTGNKGIEPPPVEPGARAKGETDYHGDRHAQESDQERDARSVEDPGKDVPTQLVSPEQIATPSMRQPSRRAEPIKEMGFIWIERGNEIRGKCHHTEST
jgi:hypothetical protein